MNKIDIKTTYTGDCDCLDCMKNFTKEEILEMSTEEINKLEDTIWKYWKLINVVNEYKQFKED